MAYRASFADDPGSGLHVEDVLQLILAHQRHDVSLAVNPDHRSTAVNLHALDDLGIDAIEHARRDSLVVIEHAGLIRRDACSPTWVPRLKQHLVDELTDV